MYSHNEYCPIDEAFDSPLSQQIKQYDKNNKIKEDRLAMRKTIEDYQKKNNIIPPHVERQPDSLGNSTRSTEAGYPLDIQHSFFNAQGDLDFNSHMSTAALGSLRRNTVDKKAIDPPLEGLEGTKLTDLKKLEYYKPGCGGRQYTDDDTYIDSSDYLSMSDDLTLPSPIKRSHNYYIETFMHEFLDDGDMVSMASSENDMYDHIKRCKYCRSMIAKKMSRTMLTDKKATVSKLQTQMGAASSILGYDLKEIIIIILVGICIIFIMDLFVKIGKKIKDSA